MAGPRIPALFALLVLAGVATLAGQQPPASAPPQVPPAVPQSPAPPQPAAPPASAPQQPPSSQVFRGGVELVSLNITVTDGTKYVTDLNQEDFEIYEDGAMQTITLFNRETQPIALAVLLDTSASMDERLPTAQEAAVGFSRRLKPKDAMEVIDFNSQPHILQTFTADQVALEKAIRSTTANGSTALYNAVYISLKELKKVKAASADEIRRQAIVLLSDGDDTSSLVGYEEVLDLAKRSETSIYAIGLRPERIGGRQEFKEAEFVLRQLSNETGGRVFFPTNVNELPKIYDQISEELSSQYTIAYASKNPLRNGAWRRIIVRTKRPGAVPRTRQGYYGPTNR